MASLSHASSFATPNTRPQQSASPLLPSYLSMDASPSFSSVHQYPSSSHLHHQLMSSDFQLIINSAAGDDQLSQGFFDGGDELILTSSWEALDKLVSASMAGSSSPSLSELDQKPLSSFYNSPISSTSASCCLHNDKDTHNNVGLHLASLFSADPSFADRAAKFSSYSQQVNPAYKSLPTLDTGSINPSTAANLASMATSKGCVVSKMELDAVFDLENQKNNAGSSPQGSMHVFKKKRAGPSPKDPVEKEDGKTSTMIHHHATKKSKKAKVQSTSSISADVSDHVKEEISKPGNAPAKLDFVHVRARRGQATDSHSLAERVRREKISERMKYLQDLVPGCTKVTGKAMVLDEIINYVQSLQHQVEFLSMKLASVPASKLELNFEGLCGKDVMAEGDSMLQHKHASASDQAHHEHYNTSMEQPGMAPYYAYPLLHNYQQLPVQSNSAINPNFPAVTPIDPSVPAHSFVSDSSLRRTVHMLAAAAATTSSDALGECISQITDAWDYDLHTSMGASGFQ